MFDAIPGEIYAKQLMPVFAF